MKFGLFYEHQLPRPWTSSSEVNLYNEILDQIALADQIGFDHLWVAEHHFLEEYANISAPEVFLGAVTQRTKNIRIGHGVMIMVPKINNTVRCAERIATLDVLSNGRVEWGTGESASRVELEGMGVPLAEKHEMWREATEQAANLVAMHPYPGYQGKHVNIPHRNMVPNSVQSPHPPLWMACTKRESVHLAAKLGMGALTFSFIDADSAKELRDEYYEIIKSEQCVPIGHSVNANFAMVMGFSCHQDLEVARERAIEGLKFFSYGLWHYYLAGEHQPGVTNLAENFEKAKHAITAKEHVQSKGIGTPEMLKANIEELSSVGIDQLIYINQTGATSHQHICDSLELFGREVLPEFKKKAILEQAKKQEELKPFIEQALKRKKILTNPNDVEPIVSYGGVGNYKVKKAS